MQEIKFDHLTLLVFDTLTALVLFDESEGLDHKLYEVKAPGTDDLDEFLSE